MEWKHHLQWNENIVYDASVRMNPIKRIKKSRRFFSPIQTSLKFITHSYKSNLFLHYKENPIYCQVTDRLLPLGKTSIYQKVTWNETKRKT